MAFKKLILAAFTLLAIAEILADVSALENSKPKNDDKPSPILANPKTIEVSSTSSSIISTSLGSTTTAAPVIKTDQNDTTGTNDTKGYVNSILSFQDHLNLDTGAVRRTFYVVVALTGVVLIYFTVKGIRMKTKRKTRRYGLLSEQELDPLDGDDEEDMTLFEAKRQKKKGRN